MGGWVGGDGPGRVSSEDVPVVFLLEVTKVTGMEKAWVDWVLGRVGGWVGGWVGCRWVEEDETVRMSYCEGGFGWVGGWVGGTCVKRCWRLRVKDLRKGPSFWAWEIW